MGTMFSSNTFLNRIPCENPWIASLIASLTGSAVLVVLGYVLLILSGGVPDGSFATCLYGVFTSFATILVMCFVAWMLEFHRAALFAP
jgi:hypothetical protein